MLQQCDIGAILRQALAGGGEFADIFYQEGFSNSIVCEDGRIERVLTGSDRGAGIRVISDLHTAYAYTNRIDPASLRELAVTVSQAVKGKRFDSNITVSEQYTDPGFPIRIPPETVDMQAKIDLIRSAERAARCHDTRITQVRVIYRDGWTRCQTANSTGEFISWENTGTVFLANVVASDGKSVQTGYEPLAGGCGFELFDAASPEDVALKAARRSITMLGARKAPAGTMPVVLAAEAGGTMVHEAVGHGLEADLVHAAVSVYRDRIGQQVASPLVSVIDDATIANARGSFPFDDEGTRAARTVLIEDGVLKGYLYDRLTAMKDGGSSTGNGRREGYHTRPIVRMTNTFIAPGKTPPEQIIKSVPAGLLVKKMGGGQVNTVTGDFMFEVTEGYLIRNGEVCEPVRGATLTGNGPEILKRIDQVGTDLGTGIGTCGKDGQGVPVSDAQPTLLISAMTVGGMV
jgi:TldD protein